MRSREIRQDAGPAFDFRVPDNDVRVYLQTQVLAGPQQAETFAKVVDSARQYFRGRPQSSDIRGQFHELDDDECTAPADLKDKAYEWFDRFGYTEGEKAWEFRFLGWKIAQLPQGVREILVVGCGSGSELVLLRSKYPDAKITAIDYIQYLKGGDAEIDLLDLRFIEGDIFRTIKTLPATFDLIFSNHVIEHFYDPDEQVAKLAALLKPGGIFAAGLPLDAAVHTRHFLAMAAKPQAISALDIGWMDLRHPWKTNETDLTGVLIASGLRNVAIIQQADHASTYHAVNMDGIQRRERKGERLYGTFLAPISSTTMALMASSRLIARLFFSVDRRLWFGRYRLKTEYTPEVFVMATTPSTEARD